MARELRAGLNLDLSKLTSTLLKADTSAKQVDERAKQTQSRVNRIVERIRRAEADAKRLNTQIRSQGVAAGKNVGRSLLTSGMVAGLAFGASELGIPEAGRPIANIATAFVGGTLLGGGPIAGLGAAASTALIEAINYAKRAHEKADRAAAEAKQAKELLRKIQADIDRDRAARERRRQQEREERREQIHEAIEEREYRFRIGEALESIN